MVYNLTAITMPGTVKLHLVLRASPEKLYRAFTEEDALSRWIAPEGFTCTVHEIDVTVGGKYKMSFRNFTTGKSHSFGGEYLELVKNEKMRYTDVFDDPNLPGKMITTVIFKEVSRGTDITITQEGIPGVIPVEQCYIGWQQSLQYLAKLVEPEIPE